MRSEYLSQEIRMISAWLSKTCEEKYLKSVKLGFFDPEDFKLEWFCIDGFPINLSFPKNFEKIVIWLKNYPSFPPAGFYIPKNSPNKDAISTRVKHIYENNPYSNDKFESIPGFYWICLHFNDWVWDFDYSCITEGDNLYKYILAIYAHFNEGFS